MAERVLQLPHQRRELLLMLLGLLIDRSLRNTDATLQTRPERAEAAADLLRPIGRPLPRQVQPIEVVRLHQRVGAIDERHAAGAALQHGRVARRRIGGCLLALAIGTAANRQQDLERGEAGAQRCDEPIVALALVEVQRRVERLQLVRGRIDAGVAVDEMRAEVQRLRQIVETEFAEACEDRERGWESRKLKKKLKISQTKNIPKTKTKTITKKD